MTTTTSTADDTERLADIAVARLQRLGRMFAGYRERLIPFANQILAHFLMSSPLGRAINKFNVLNSMALIALEDELFDRGVDWRPEPPIAATAGALAMREHALPPRHRRPKSKPPASAECLGAMLVYVTERLALLEEVQRNTEHCWSSLQRERRAWERIGAAIAQTQRGTLPPKRRSPVRKPLPPIVVLPPETVAAYEARMRQSIGDRAIGEAERRGDRREVRRLIDQRRDLQRQLAIDFGNRHGWRLSSSDFDLEALGRPPRYRRTYSFDSDTLDHPFFYREREQPYRPAGIAAHLYAFSDAKRALVMALAARLNLIAETSMTIRPGGTLVTARWCSTGESRARDARPCPHRARPRDQHAPDPGLVRARGGAGHPLCAR
jgi:hypothetical protein